MRNTTIDLTHDVKRDSVAPPVKIHLIFLQIQAHTMSTTYYFPNELIESIFSHLSFRDALELRQVNRQWRSISLSLSFPVHLREDQITGPWIGRHPQLVKSILINERNLAKMSNSLQMVVELDASWGDVSWQSLLGLTARLPNLRRLNLSGMARLSNSTLGFILTTHSQLTHLNVSRCHDLSPAVLDWIHKLPSLQMLDLSHTRIITLDGMLSLVKSLECLVSLSLRSAFYLNQQDWLLILETIGLECRSLRALDASQNSMLTDEALASFGQALGCRLLHLSHIDLNLENCDQVSHQSVNSLRHAFPCLLTIRANPLIQDYSPQGIRQYLDIILSH